MSQVIEIHIHVHPDEVDPNIVQILNVVQALQEGETSMSLDIADLTDKVAAVSTVDQSAIVLLEGLSAAITAAGTDPAALAALTTSLDASNASLAAAVAANTPAVAPPVVEPPADVPAP